MRQPTDYGMHFKQEGRNVRATGIAGEYCFLNQTVDAITTHMKTSSDTLFAAFGNHVSRHQCCPDDALLRQLSTYLALVYIHRFNAWNNEPRKRPSSYSLDIAWSTLERWNGTQEIVKFAHKHAGPDWQVFAQCVGLLSQEEFIKVIKRMQEFENGW